MSSTQLKASISAADISTARTIPVTVFNPTPGGGTSNSVIFTVNNPLPAINSLAPSSATAGGAAFTLIVNGSNFVAKSLVRWNGSNRTTTFVSSTRLKASISAADIATAKIVPVTVFNPGPGGGPSSATNFTVNNPVPAIASLSPSSAKAGNPAFTLIETGSAFVAKSVVRWNGSNRITTFVSNTQLKASITAANISTAKVVTVTVINPTPGGGTSNAKNFTITP